RGRAGGERAAGGSGDPAANGADAPQAGGAVARACSGAARAARRHPDGRKRSSTALCRRRLPLTTASSAAAGAGGEVVGSSRRRPGRISRWPSTETMLSRETAALAHPGSEPKSNLTFLINVVTRLSTAKMNFLTAVAMAGVLAGVASILWKRGESAVHRGAPQALSMSCQNLCNSFPSKQCCDAASELLLEALLSPPERWHGALLVVSVVTREVHLASCQREVPGASRLVAADVVIQCGYPVSGREVLFHNPNMLWPRTDDDVRNRLSDARSTKRYSILANALNATANQAAACSGIKPEDEPPSRTQPIIARNSFDSKLFQTVRADRGTEGVARRPHHHRHFARLLPGLNNRLARRGSDMPALMLSHSKQREDNSPSNKTSKGAAAKAAARRRRNQQFSSSSCRSTTSGRSRAVVSPRPPVSLDPGCSRLRPGTAPLRAGVLRARVRLLRARPGARPARATFLLAAAAACRLAKELRAMINRGPPPWRSSGRKPTAVAALVSEVSAPTSAAAATKIVDGDGEEKRGRRKDAGVRADWFSIRGWPLAKACHASSLTRDVKVSPEMSKSYRDQSLTEMSKSHPEMSKCLCTRDRCCQPSRATRHGQLINGGGGPAALEYGCTASMTASNKVLDFHHPHQLREALRPLPWRSAVEAARTWRQILRRLQGDAEYAVKNRPTRAVFNQLSSGLDVNRHGWRVADGRHATTNNVHLRDRACFRAHGGGQPCRRCESTSAGRAATASWLLAAASPTCTPPWWPAVQPLPGGEDAGMRAVPEFGDVHLEGRALLGEEVGGAILGMGMDSVYLVDTDNRGKMLAGEHLEQLIGLARSRRKPFFVSAQPAGTTRAGRLRRRWTRSRTCGERRHGLWFHVTRPGGGGVLLSQRHRHLLAGVQRADSVTWNPHKLMGVTLQCSVILLPERHIGLLQGCNGMQADYLFQQDKQYDVSYDTGDKSIQCGRRNDIFKLWLSWRA
uniref:Protein kinase domain-containing protein n=1 Tax=Macrostomum lignano TaxID=282301 RepID=A0A1I8F5H9_9PLAT